MAMDFLEICARMTSACPWPEGAEEQPALTESGSRIVSACASVAYSLLTEAESQRPTIDREALAAALHDAYVADEAIVWGERCEDVRQGYRREADTAIRLCAGADAGARIADLETRIATLTATANAAVERAEEAEVRAAKAEKALRLSADAAEAATTDEEDARRELYDARAENDRLRRALYIATQATAHMSTVAALLTGEADDA